MRIITLLLGCLVFSGCKNTTKGFEELADRACACAEGDTACGSKVLADVSAFTDSNKSSDGDQKRITEAGVRLNDCLTSAGVKEKHVVAALEKMVQ